jgi:hypothetical protein
VTTWLRFPNRATHDTAVALLAMGTEPRQECARLLQFRFANYAEKPETGYGAALAAVLDAIEAMRAANGGPVVHRPRVYVRRRNRRAGR